MREPHENEGLTVFVHKDIAIPDKIRVLESGKSANQLSR